jgi:hypothetical protein
MLPRSSQPNSSYGNQFSKEYALKAAFAGKVEATQSRKERNFMPHLIASRRALKTNNRNRLGKNRNLISVCLARRA